VIARPLDAAPLRAHLFSAVESVTATWLSGLRRAASRSFRPIWALARLSQGKVGMLVALALGSPVLTGCLVADAPTYGPPQQRPPVINTEGVSPSQYKLQLFQANSPPMLITVPVRSEDAGDDLKVTLWLDYALPSPAPKHFDEQTIPASSFDKTDRSYQTSFSPDERVTRGCGHTLTVLIMHESNYFDGPDVPKEGSSYDVASVTWSLNVFPDDPNVIEVCSPTGAP
jgi:hypothetical protein